MEYQLIALFLISLFVFTCTSDVKKGESVRLKHNINCDWQFAFSTESDDFSGPTEDGAPWDRVELTIIPSSDLSLGVETSFSQKDWKEVLQANIHLQMVTRLYLKYLILQ